jgi:hypothetical protein
MILACLDPVAWLREAAGHYGTLAIEAVSGNYGGSLDDADPAEGATWLASRTAIDAPIAALYARTAWRYAHAAYILARVPGPALYAWAAHTPHEADPSDDRSAATEPGTHTR